VLIGIFEKAGLQVPIAVVETQMGCPATQINMREALHYASNFGYMVGSTFVHSDGIYVIRAGTAGGVNDLKRTSPVVGIGDILIATKSYGAIGAVIQSTLGRLDFLNGASAMAETFAYDHPDIIGTVATGTLLTSKCSSRLVIALSSAANALGIAPITGPDFTKDSLYAELTEAGFALLRERYGIVSTEMEQLVIDVLAAEFRRAGLQVHSGLVSAAIGAIPGKSFPVTPAEKALAAQAEVHAMLIAANALADIALAANK
jgi:uridine phosphorylase